MCFKCRRAQTTILSLLLSQELTPPPEMAGERTTEMLTGLESSEMKVVRSCLALLSTASLPTNETEEAVLRDLDMGLVIKAQVLFPPSVADKAATMARNLAEHMTAVADLIEKVLLQPEEGEEPEVEERAPGHLDVFLNRPAAPTIIAPHNGGRGPKPPVS